MARRARHRPTIQPREGGQRLVLPAVRGCGGGKDDEDRPSPEGPRVAEDVDGKREAPPRGIAGARQTRAAQGRHRAQPGRNSRTRAHPRASPPARPSGAQAREARPLAAPAPHRGCARRVWATRDGDAAAAPRGHGAVGGGASHRIPGRGDGRGGHVAEHAHDGTRGLALHREGREPRHGESGGGCGCSRRHQDGQGRRGSQDRLLPRAQEATEAGRLTGRRRAGAQEGQGDLRRRRPAPTGWFGRRTNRAQDGYVHRRVSRRGEAPDAPVARRRSAEGAPPLDPTRGRGARRGRRPLRPRPVGGYQVFEAKRSRRCARVEERG
mmetsp:Transcript_2720/g.11660  ORF Transcript_2720/g.11660 Transcript_2720/m.11660 type:complete len:324 (-) Transcript_2720:418-1389(-)